MSLLAGGTIVAPTLRASRFANRSIPSLTKLSRRSGSVVALARREGGVSSRTRRSDKGKKSPVITKEKGEGAAVNQEPEEIEILWEISEGPMPELPGLEKDFWEGSQWNTFGFLMQYLWAFGIVFAVIACGVAVTTYNQGATDFRDTPTYKESMQSKELLDESDSSSQVFEQNPTEVAPPLE